MGRITRDIERKELNPDSKLKDLLEKANILFNQKKADTNKLYSIHAPEVECISKGKAHKKYEFGCKVSLVTSSRNNWILGIQALSGNPYDGHTLASSIEQMKKICEVEPKENYADKGYKDKTGISENIQLHTSGKSKKNMTLWQRKWMKGNRINFKKYIVYIQN
jgi:transposase, IS5 family